KAQADLVVLVSDNESWLDSRRRGATQTLVEWERFKNRNPKARLVCIDVQPYATSQAPERSDVLNVGGFGDDVFKVLAMFAAGELGAAHWVGLIEEVALPPA
ncbi:MAG: RNA-binding protein, partial [Hylemonella sp.]|nr:RNA-binding protein [Hylemonella sp.]